MTYSHAGFVLLYTYNVEYLVMFYEMYACMRIETQIQ